MIDRLLLEVTKRKSAIEQGIFTNPPNDMDDFNRRLGRWLELSETSAWVAELLRALDEEE